MAFQLRKQVRIQDQCLGENNETIYSYRTGILGEEEASISPSSKGLDSLGVWVPIREHANGIPNAPPNAVQ